MNAFVTSEQLLQVSLLLNNIFCVILVILIVLEEVTMKGKVYHGVISVNMNFL